MTSAAVTRLPAEQHTSGVVWFVVPDWVDDVTRPSGGNGYDRQVADSLAGLGWQVTELKVPGDWPSPGAEAQQSLAGRLAVLPDGAVVLLDGLIASAAAPVLLPHGDRLRLVMLVHLPLGAGVAGDDPGGVRRAERLVLAAAAAVITTSRWSRQQVLELYDLPPALVHVAEPGVAAAPPAAGTTTGGQLLCVAAVTPHKGQHRLVSALTAVGDLPWRCVFVGSLERDPAFADELRELAAAGGVADRLDWAGALVGAELDAAYAAADVLLLASAGETYGMVVTEALARGLPVIAGDVGGVPEALGFGAGGRRPGLLVPPGDPAALAAALRSWLTNGALRQQLRAAAGQRRGALERWSTTAQRVGRVLAAVTS